MQNFSESVTLQYTILKSKEKNWLKINITL